MRRTALAPTPIPAPQGCHDRGHRPPRRDGGVHAFAQGPQRNTTLTKVSNSTSDLGDQAAQPIDRRHHHGVAVAGIGQQRGQPRPHSPRRPGQLVGEHPTRILPRGTPAPPVGRGDPGRPCLPWHNRASPPPAQRLTRTDHRDLSHAVVRQQTRHHDPDKCSALRLSFRVSRLSTFDPPLLTGLPDVRFHCGGSFSSRGR